MKDSVYVYVILGAATGEWRNWVEGIYTNESVAHYALEKIEDEDDYSNTFYIVSGPLDSPEFWEYSYD